MAAKSNLRTDLDNLKSDASRVLTDISELTKNISQVDAARDISRQVATTVDEEIVSLKARIAELNETLKKSAATADQHVHEKPYLYIFGALGLGALMGKVFLPGGRE